MANVLSHPQALYDYYFLINRGYTPSQAEILVTSLYQLQREDRILLRRCVHSAKTNTIVEARLLEPETVKGRKLCIDGYNQLITIIACLRGRPIYKCTDGMIRDNELGRLRLNTNILKEVAIIVRKALQELSPEQTIIVLDAAKSWSARHAKTLREMLPEAIVVLSRKTDKTLITYSRNNYIIASSDILVVLNSKEVLDLAGLILQRRCCKVTDITLLLQKQHKYWCAGP